MKEILNQLAHDLDMQVPDSIRRIFYYPDEKEKCNEILHSLAEDSTPLKNMNLYHCVETYLYNQVFDCDLLTADEEVLTHYFSTIDQDQIVRVKITPELLDRVTREDESLTSDEWQSAGLYLDMLLVDGIQSNNSNESKAIDKYFPDDVDTHGEIVHSYEETVEFIYGYNILDRDEVLKVIEKNQEKLIPFKKREVNLIKRLHNLDPYMDLDIPF